MKLIKTTMLFFAIIISTIALAGNNDTLNQPKRDILVSVTAQVHDNTVYIKLLMTNESKPGFYSLVKVFEDESIESVEIKNITINTINQPLLYSFKDKSISVKPVTYSLIRISHKTEVVQTWKCSDIGGYFCIEQSFPEYTTENIDNNKGSISSNKNKYKNRGGKLPK